jgi:hypothetical protein
MVSPSSAAAKRIDCLDTSRGNYWRNMQEMRRKLLDAFRQRSPPESMRAGTGPIGIHRVRRSHDDENRLPYRLRPA